MAKKKKISFAEAAEYLGKKKCEYEKKIAEGDTFTRNALQPKIDKINSKLDELKLLNDEAKNKKLAAGFNRFQKKYGGYLEKFSPGGPPYASQYNPSQYIFNTSQSDVPKVSVPEQVFEEPEYRQDTNIVMEDYDEPESNRANMSNFALAGTQLAPAVFNIFKGLQKPDTLDPIYNPERLRAKRLAEEAIDRDVSAQLAANQEMEASLRKTAKTGSQGHGATYQMMATNAARNKALQDARTYQWKQNTEAEAKARAASQLFGFGASDQAERQRKQQYDAQAEAVRDQYMATGLGDVSRYSQTQQQIRNQRERDAMLDEMIRKRYYSFFVD